MFGNGALRYAHKEDLILFTNRRKLRKFMPPSYYRNLTLKKEVMNFQVVFKTNIMFKPHLKQMMNKVTALINLAVNRAVEISWAPDPEFIADCKLR